MEARRRPLALANLEPARRQVLESFLLGHLPAGQLVSALSAASAAANRLAGPAAPPSCGEITVEIAAVPVQT